MGHVILETGKPSVMTLSCSGVEVTVNGQAPEAAQKQPMTEEKVLKQLNKTGNTPFFFEHLSAELKGEMFLPVQALNELRRSGLKALESACSSHIGRDGSWQACQAAGKWTIN